MAVGAAVWIVPGITIVGSNGTIAVVVMALVLALINASIKPILQVLSLPITVMLETFRKLKAEHGTDFDHVAHGHAKGLRGKEILDWMIQGCEDILAGRTDKDMDYQYFGGVCRQHPISGTLGEVIVYNEDK